MNLQYKQGFGGGHHEIVSNVSNAFVDLKTV